MTEDDYIKAVKLNNQRLYILALSFTKNHYDAQDIIQNVFLKLWKFEGSFESIEHMNKWLTRVCLNESKNYIKLPFRKNTTLDDAKNLYSFDSPKDFDVFNAVMSLPKKERTIIHLFYYEDMLISDMANLLNMKEPTVKTKLRRAREKLKQILGDEWIYE